MEGEPDFSSAPTPARPSARRAVDLRSFCTEGLSATARSALRARFRKANPGSATVSPSSTGSSGGIAFLSPKMYSRFTRIWLVSISSQRA